MLSTLCIKKTKYALCILSFNFKNSSSRKVSNPIFILKFPEMEIGKANYLTRVTFGGKINMRANTQL